MTSRTHHFIFFIILFTFLSLGITLAIQLFIQIKNTPVVAGQVDATCVYTYSDWGECKDSGKQYRTLLTTEPPECQQVTRPLLEKTCTPTPTTNTPGTTTNYQETIKETGTARETVSCTYTYSNWGECKSNNRQERTVLSKSPTDCVKTTEPVIEQACHYIAPTPTSCTYTYDDWDHCQPDNKQKRKVQSKTPDGCNEDPAPILIRECTYVKTTSKKGSEETTTPTFKFSNISDEATFLGSVMIQGKVKDATNVEFYLIAQESNLPKYLGSAKNVSSDLWQYTFDSTQLPDGKYFLRAKIKNAYGTYESEKKKVLIKNQKEQSKNSPIPHPAVNDNSQINTSQVSVQQEKIQEKKPSVDNQRSATRNFNGSTTPEWQKKYFGQEECQNEKVCGQQADPDRDELNNGEEFRFGTDPKIPDTDRDSFLDGDEVKNGFNPLQTAQGDKSDKIVFENPKEKGTVKRSIYQVNQVEMVKPAHEKESKKIKITGKALPNTYVTIYIYSDPIVLTVKTDDQGNWTYELDKELEDGEHQVYVAVTDNTGKITAKSEALSFVKTAQAVTVVPKAEAATNVRTESPTKAWSRKDYFFFIAIGLSALALALATIGLISHSLNKNVNYKA